MGEQLGRQPHDRERLQLPSLHRLREHVRLLPWPAPGRTWGHCARQDIASVSSHRPFWQYHVYRELTEVAYMVRIFQ